MGDPYNYPKEWILGIFMMSFLAYKLEMSTNVSQDIEALKHDIYEKLEAD